MKKLSVFCILLSICIAHFAQSKQDALSALRNSIVLNNKQLPLRFSFVTLQKFEINYNNYIVCAEIDENQQNLDSYVSYMNQNKSNIFTLISGQRKEFTKLFITSELNLMLKVTGSLSKRTKVIYLSSSEIKKAFEDDYTSKDFVRDVIVEMKKSLPMDWGQGLTCTNIDIEEDYVCYRIKTDETFITIPLLKLYKSEGTEMEESLLEGLNSMTDEAELLLIKQLKQSNMGMKYIFWSEKSADTVTFELPSIIIKTKVNDD